MVASLILFRVVLYFLVKNNLRPVPFLLSNLVSTQTRDGALNRKRGYSCGRVTSWKVSGAGRVLYGRGGAVLGVG